METAQRTTIPGSQHTPLKSKSWHNSLHSAANVVQGTPPRPWDSQSPHSSTRHTPESTPPGKPRPYPELVKGSLADAIDADGDSSDADAPAYIILGACRRQVRPGISLEELWKSFPSLDSDTGSSSSSTSSSSSSRALCVCTSRSAPSCKHASSSPFGTPNPNRTRSGSASTGKRGGGWSRGSTEALKPLNEATNQVHAQAYNMRRAEETLLQLKELQVQGKGEGGTCLPILMARVEKEGGRAEIAFRADHVILPGVTYRAYAPRSRPPEDGKLEEAVDSGSGKRDAQLAGAGVESGGAHTWKQVESQVGQQQAQRREGVKCTLSFPDGSSMRFPAGITLMEATQELIRSAADAPRGTLKQSSFGALLPSAAGVAAIAASHLKQTPLTQSLRGHPSGRDTSAILASTKSSSDLAALQLRPSQTNLPSPSWPSAAGQHHPLLLLARTNDGCRVLIRPHDMLEADVEYQVKVRVPQGTRSASADGIQAQGEMNRSAGERWGRQSPTRRGQQATDKGVGVGGARGAFPSSSSRAKAPDPTAQTGSQVPQGHYRSLWGGSTKILAQASSREASPGGQRPIRGQLPVEANRRAAQVVPNQEVDFPSRPMTAPGGGRRMGLGGFLSRPAGATNLPQGVGVNQYVGMPAAASGVGWVVHNRSSSNLSAGGGKPEERATTMFDGALKTFSTWWQK